MDFKLPKLNYAKSALAPIMSEETLDLHHGKHHQTYITNLNKALDSYPELFEKSIEDLLVNLDQIPESIRVAVRNGGGGHYNHSLFWETIGPKTENKISEKMNFLISESFDNFDNFKAQFTEKATKQFGSGWGWLAQDNGGKLVTLSTPNQDTPLSSGLNPILGIDVWEHAYYLNYQNRRPDYINAFWEIINWEVVESKLK